MKLKVITGLLLTLFLMGMLTLAFNIQPVKAESGTIYIRANGSIDPPTANITSVDNVTYTFTANINDSIVVQRNNIVVDGAGYALQGTGILDGTGINTTQRSNVTIKNIEIKAFKYGICFNYSSNSTVHGNNITDNLMGVELYRSSNNTIYGNNVRNYIFSIVLRESSNNTVYGNNITNNDHGIHLCSSSYNAVYGNNITNNWDGIILGGSSNNTVYGNNITDNGLGIWIPWSSSNLISGNHIANNGYGIYLSNSSSNIISGNNITNNNEGMQVLEASNNIIYHNLINNTYQVYSENSTNTWDDGYPSGGNYWSDYNGTDADQDGIGDTPYEIDENNQDNHPLMGLFSHFSVDYEEETYHVTTICNSSISDFQFNGTAIRFNVSGENGTTGFCRICIPTALMNDTYKVFVNGTEVPHTMLPCSNSTYSYLYFTYVHSIQEVIIIPEFPAWASIVLMLIVLTVATAIHKRRLLKTSIQ